MKKLFVLATAAALFAPALVQAQHHHWRNREERLARIDALVRDCENRSDTFKASLARALDHSRLDGSYREHRLNADARRLEQAMNVVREAWNRDRDVDRAKRHVRDAIYAGRDIERAMPRFYLRSYIESDWHMLRAELNRLAEIFDVAGISIER
jgi:hypothetical protein